MSKYSMGMRQRLGVAACLIGDPQLLIFDEVERTCDAVAIVDRSNVIRQGSIAELLAGSSGIAGSVEVRDSGLAITMPSGTERGVITEINRVLGR